jgi:hypothetical protein
LKRLETDLRVFCMAERVGTKGVRADL